GRQKTTHCTRKRQGDSSNRSSRHALNQDLKMVSSPFAEVPLAPKDPILGITEQYNADPRPDKVNLGVGVYYDETGKLPLLDAVRKAEDALAAKHGARGYLPIDGINQYNKAVQS